MMIAEAFRQAVNSDIREFSLLFDSLRRAYPDEIARLGLAYLSEKGPDDVGKQVVGWLCNGNRYLPLLLDRKLLTLEAAAKMIKLFRDAELQFFPKFAGLISQTEVQCNSRELQSAIELVMRLGNYDALSFPIRALTNHQDPCVQSKGVKALWHLLPNTSAIQHRHFHSEDARVRANAIEAIWRSNTPEAESIFLSALRDTDHRVILNALVGRYFVGDAGAFDKMVELSKHESAKVRRAAVWAFGFILDRRARPVLEQLVCDLVP